MRLAILGATGRTGRVVVDQALRQGQEVTALARDPAGLPRHERLRIVAGDVRDAAIVARTIEGADAVLSTLGRRRGGPEVCTEGIRTLLATMGAGDRRRLVVLTNYGVAESHHRTAYVAVSWLLERSVLLDKEHMEALLRESDADWTLVRAPIVTDGAPTGRYRTGTDLRLSFTSRVSRGDLAEFMLAEAQRDARRRLTVAITG